MLAIVRAPHTVVASALRAEGVGTVGPTSESGWTAVWIPDVAPLTGLADLASIEEDLVSTTLRVVREGWSASWTWHVGETEALEDDVRAAAAAICQLFGRCDAAGEVSQILESAPFADELATDLAEVLDLPELWEPEPSRKITLQRGDPTAARMAARMAARVLGPTAIGTLEDGWSVLLPVGKETQARLPYAVAAASSARRSTVLALWRGDHGASGFELLQGGHIIVEGRWNTRWLDLDEDDWESRDADARALAHHVAHTDVDHVGLRAVVRARTWSGDPLAELVSLLGLPGSSLAVLDGRTDAPKLEPATPASAWHAIRAALSERNGDPWITARWLQVTLAVFAIGIGIVGVAAAVVGWGVLATHGAFVEQDSVGPGDVAFTLAVTVTAPLNLWCGAQLIRRGTLF